MENLFKWATALIHGPTACKKFTSEVEKMTNYNLKKKNPPKNKTQKNQYAMNSSLDNTAQNQGWVEE